MSHDDEIARLRAEMDQAKEGLKEAAGTFRSLYMALVGEGFSGGEALQIVIAWFTTLVRNGATNDD